MTKLRSVSTGFWSDPFIEELSPNEKLLFLYLITNEKTNMLGIYESSIKKISFETDLDQETIRKALEGFERIGKVKYQNNYVILVNYLKHQNFNTNMKKSAIDIYNNLPKELKDNKLTISKVNPSEGFERLRKHFGILPKVETEVEDETEDEFKEKENIKQEILSSQKWIDDISYTKKITPEKTKDHLITFLDDLELKEDLDRSLSEIKSHFISWLNIELKKEKEVPQKLGKGSFKEQTSHLNLGQHE